MADSQKTIAKNIAPDNLELLIAIVHSDKVRFYTNLIQSMEANLFMTVSASGTSEKAIMEYLGLIQSNRSAIVTVVREDKKKDLLEALDDNFTKLKGGGGIAFTIPLSSIIGSLVYEFLSNDKPSVKS